VLALPGMKMHSHQIRFDADLIRRYDRSGPRYTSYPTAVQFTDRFGLNEYRAAAIASNQDPIRGPVAVRAHPVLSSPVSTAAARRSSRATTRRPKRTSIAAPGDRAARPAVRPRPRGGAAALRRRTPTFLTSLEIDRLIEKLGSHFKLSRDPTRE